ncbi:serine/threonine-protein kinase [Actinomadura roseirufa]|uniref:serine/threonine-protein kinase n=1 Tax=Actinomadura roseirufa TaxID=2094049 RepID=UPI001040F52F|nr:serine/threonine-protein kinase [Actinomadura roseirufa]
MLILRLKRSFRYVHEPLRTGETSIPLLGNENLADDLRDRIVYSRGGAFLVTGFRGVGKSTTVLRALDTLLHDAGRSEAVLPVVLSVARSTDTDRLLFAIVRRIFEALHDQGLLARLPRETQRSLLLAYMRTSLSFKETRSDAVERTVGGETAGGSVLKAIVPKLTMSAKRTRSLATEAQFLAYSETDVEHDIMRIVSLLDLNGSVPSPPRSPLRRIWPWPRATMRRLRLVVVLDEADKLSEGEAGLVAVEKLLGGIKNVLTMPGVHFLVVAGPDLHDRVIKDASRGNSVYESVFGWRMYVPCAWNAVERLLAGTVEPGQEDQADQLRIFGDYLRFKARGVPRRLLQEFNEFVSWQHHAPILEVSPRDAPLIGFYARLENILRDFMTGTDGAPLFPIPIDEDRRRLSAYYVVDWVLRSEGEPIRASDLFQEERDAEFDPLLQVSRRSVDRLLAHLADQGVVETLRRGDGHATIYGDVSDAQESVYRVARDVRQTLLSFALRYESERAALDVTTTGVHTNPATPVIGGRYELVSALGAGGMSEVWSGHDRLLGRTVAVKMLRTALREEPGMLARARREAEITSRLEHPNIVRCYDVVSTEDLLALVLEFVPGMSLSQHVTENGPLTAAEAARMAIGLAEALEYLEHHHIFRLDLKPSNVMLHPERGPVLIDLGIARTINSPRLTSPSMVIGTPAYLAPEALTGDDLDHRGDIHALGMTLCYSLSGQDPLGQGPIQVVVAKLMNEDIDLSGLRISPEFREALSLTLRKDPDDRFQSASALLKTLRRLPEQVEAPTVEIPRPPAPAHNTTPDP